MNFRENIKKFQTLEEGRVVRAPGAYLRGANLKKAILKRNNPNCYYTMG